VNSPAVRLALVTGGIKLQCGVDKKPIAITNAAAAAAAAGAVI